MRITAFIMGGIVGAAAAVYLSRRSKPLLFSSFGQSGGALGKAMAGAKNKMFNLGGSHDHAHAGGKSDYSSGLEQVKNFVNNDAGLKSAVDDILQDGNGGKH